jgi:hypothetical protein
LTAIPCRVVAAEDLARSGFPILDLEELVLEVEDLETEAEDLETEAEGLETEDSEVVDSELVASEDPEAEFKFTNMSTSMLHLMRILLLARVASAVDLLAPLKSTTKSFSSRPHPTLNNWPNNKLPMLPLPPKKKLWSMCSAANQTHCQMVEHQEPLDRRLRPASQRFTSSSTKRSREQVALEMVAHLEVLLPIQVLAVVQPFHRPAMVQLFKDSTSIQSFVISCLRLCFKIKYLFFK